MSLLDNLITWYNGPTKPEPKKPHTPRAKEVKRHVPQGPKGFGDLKEVVIYLPMRMDRLVVAEGMGITPPLASYAVNDIQMREIAEFGYCSAITNYAPTADYWRQPAENALRVRLENMLKCKYRKDKLTISTGLRSSAHDCGSWFLIELLSAEELAERLPPQPKTDIAAL